MITAICYLDFIHRPYIYIFNHNVYDPQLLHYCLIWGTQISSNSPQVLYLGKRDIIILILFLHFVTQSDLRTAGCVASVLSTQCPPIEASSINRTQQSRFHLITREEPSLETLWLKNIRTMDKVQITDCSTVIQHYRQRHLEMNQGHDIEI
jgi:hypothetical protein